MPDSKITALASTGTGTDPANDPLVIVDVSDTSMAATGTTKKVTLNNLLACSPTATLASATITGDLTVDTSTLYVNSSTDRVGVGTTSLSEKLNVAGNISANAWLGRGNIAAPSGDCSIFRSADNTLGFGIASTTAMTLNANGLGVGVVPAAGKGALQLSSGINFPATQVTSADANTLDDYEEGTFTPTIIGSTTAGTGVYTLNQGRYTKIGNRVFCDVYISWSAHTGTGNILLEGLPFTSNAAISAIKIGLCSNLALTAGNILTGVTSASSTQISFQQYPSGGGARSAVPMDTAAEIQFSVCYFV